MPFDFSRLKIPPNQSIKQAKNVLIFSQGCDLVEKRFDPAMTELPVEDFEEDIEVFGGEGDRHRGFRYAGEAVEKVTYQCGIIAGMP